MKMILMVAALCAGLTNAALAQSTQPTPAPGPYDLPSTMPDAGSQLAAMLALYDEVCFRNFPDEEAAARALAQRHATPMTEAEVYDRLHDDPGIGWFVETAAGSFAVTIERPPYHACGVRALTALGGFTDMQPYVDFALQKANGRTGEQVGPVRIPVRGTISRGWGVSYTDSDQNVEGMLVFETTPDAPAGTSERLGTEIRFVRQLIAHQ